jgi:RNA polymerase sigma factor (sigma-70 family)
MGNHYGKLFRDWEIAVAKRLVYEFRRRWKCLEREDFDDLLQECLAHWYFARAGYDPGLQGTQKALMARVISNKLMDLVRARTSDRRKVAYLSLSIDMPLDTDLDSRTLMDEIDESACMNAPLYLLRAHLTIDISRALQKLSPSQRRLCRLLGEDQMTVKAISDRLGTPRSSIYDELKRIKTVFIKLGLKDYLE